MRPEAAILYRAPFVVPVQAPLIEDGALLVAGGTIAAVGRYADLKGEVARARVVDLEQRLLVPALINCHAHLELSWMAALGRRNAYFAPGDLVGWIQALLAMRDADTSALAWRLDLARQAAVELRRSGVAVVADIGNSPASAQIGSRETPEHLFFQELMGLSAPAAEQAQASVADSSLACTAHGPYSCHPRLIRFAKKRASSRAQLFPIHVAESSAEREFLQTGSGRFYDFLNERLAAIGELQGRELKDHFTPPQCGSLEYLDRLGVLDEQTICIHGVHVKEAEIELLAARRSKVCLCPGSNRFLGVGKAPAGSYLQKAITVGLGTDSLASNPELSIWREMRLLAEDHPSLAPRAIFTMATAGGAATLGLADRLGTLAPGRSARVLAVSGAARLTGAQVFDYLVSGRQQPPVAWLGETDD